MNWSIPMPPMRSLLLSMSVLPWVMACESDSALPEPPADTSDIYWSLDLDHRAVALATAMPHDTLTITAVPRNSSGDAIAGLPAPQYTSRDVERVIAMPDGRLIAQTPTPQPVWIVARLATDNLVYTDSSLVVVAADDPLPVLTSFWAGPISPDSAKAPVHIGEALMHPFVLAVRAEDAGSAPMPNLPIFFHSSDPRTATIDRVAGVIRGQKPGNVTLYASTTAFHVTKADTVAYQIGWPVWAKILLTWVYPPDGSERTVGFVPSEIRVGRGALVQWQIFGESVESYDVVFAEADAPTVGPAITYAPQDKFTYPYAFYCSLVLDCATSGNLTSNTTGLRVFPSAGTYEYHSAIHGIRGRVVVVDEP